MALAFGGNKVRQLEYYLGDALAKGADTVLITSAVQSNFMRLPCLGRRCRSRSIRVVYPHRRYHRALCLWVGSVRRGTKILHASGLSLRIYTVSSVFQLLV